MKLSKAQKRVLLVLLEYDCVAYVHSDTGGAFFGHPCPSTHKVRWRTLYILQDKQLIFNTTPEDWRGDRYALAQEGKTLALEILEEK